MSKQPYVPDWASDHVFTVEEIEDGCWQSVFPARLAELSAAHPTAADAWHYIAECIVELELTPRHTLPIVEPHPDFVMTHAASTRSTAEGDSDD